jgi:hypothetical protein
MHKCDSDIKLKKYLFVFIIRGENYEKFIFNFILVEQSKVKKNQIIH